MTGKGTPSPRDSEKERGARRRLAILLSGRGSNFEAICDAIGDGRIPHASRPQYGDVTEFLRRFRQMAADAGRDPGSVSVTVWGVGEDPDRLKRHRDLGVTRVVVSLLSAPAVEVLPVLDRWAELMVRVREE